MSWRRFNTLLLIETLGGASVNHTVRIAFCGIMAGVGLALMFLTALLPMATFALPALAGVLLIMIVIEMNVRWALSVFAVTALLSAFLVPDKQAALLYIIFLGYYPVLKALFERVKNRVLQWVLKYAVFNGAIVSAYFIAIYLLSIPADSFSLFGVSLPWMFWIAGNVVFFVYDIALSGIVVFYMRQLHKVFRKWFSANK